MFVTVNVLISFAPASLFKVKEILVSTGTVTKVGASGLIVKGPLEMPDRVRLAAWAPPAVLALSVAVFGVVLLPLWG